MSRGRPAVSRFPALRCPDLSVCGVSAGQGADWVLTGADRPGGVNLVPAGQVSDRGAVWPVSNRWWSVSKSGRSLGWRPHHTPHHTTRHKVATPRATSVATRGTP